MSARYLTKPIAETKIVPADVRPHLTRDGYTKRSGAPTERMIRLDGEKCWRRLMIWQFSNLGTYFVRIKGRCLIVPANDIPALPQQTNKRGV